MRRLHRALKSHPAEALCEVISWAHEAHDDERAKYLQEHGYLGLNNLMDVDKLTHRVERAALWRERTGQAAPPVAAVVADLPPPVAADLDLLLAWLPTGSANRPPVYSQHPDRTAAARVATAVIRSGGWPPLYAQRQQHLPRVVDALVVLHGGRA